MSMSTFQKVTLVSCLVLCVALLLPKMLLSRGKKDNQQSEGPGHFPPMVRRQVAPEGQRGSGAHFSRAHNPEAIARAKGGGTGAAPTGKSSLAGQIIPIYGFGILLYILYILFKITSKGKNSKPPQSRLATLRSENMKRKITDFELAQLQEKLKETEDVMERIVSQASPRQKRRIKGVSSDQEETLLLQLKEITNMMNKGSLLEGIITHERKAENPCTQHWEGYEEDPYSKGGCCYHGHSHGYQDMGDEWTERPEDNKETNLKEEGAGSDPTCGVEDICPSETDLLKENDAERRPAYIVEDICPTEIEEGTKGSADTDDLLENMRQASAADGCALNGEDSSESLEDKEFNEVLEPKQVMQDEDCSVRTSALSKHNSAQIRKRGKK